MLDMSVLTLPLLFLFDFDIFSLPGKVQAGSERQMHPEWNLGPFMVLILSLLNVTNPSGVFTLCIPSHFYLQLYHDKYSCLSCHIPLLHST